MMIFLLLPLLAFADLDEASFLAAKPGPEKKAAVAYVPMRKGVVDYLSRAPNPAGFALEMGYRIRLAPSPEEGRVEARIENLRFEMSFSQASLKAQEQHMNLDLSDSPLFFSFQGNAFTDVSGLEAARKKALQQTKSAQEGQFVLQFLEKENLLRTGGAAKAEGCLTGIAGKKPGARWKADLATDQATLKLQCRFLGWWKEFMLVEAEIAPSRLPAPGGGAMKSKGTMRVLARAEESWSEIKLENELSLRGTKVNNKLLTRFRHYP